MNLTDMTANIFVDLSAAAATEWTQAEMERAVDVAVAELSRHSPRELMAEFTVPAAVSAEAWTSSYGVAVALANKPIKWGSEVIKQSGTEFVKDTDYTIDYINGTITTLAAGSMADLTASTADYTIHRVIFDISGELDSNYIAIEEVQAGTLINPLTPSGYELWGDWMELVTDGQDTQSQVGESQHIRIKYTALHTAPTANASGTYRRHLDEIVVRGAAGFVLRIKAADLEHQAVTDLASLRTAVANVAVFLTSGTRAADDALGDMATQLAAALTVLGAIRGTSTEPFDRALTALDAISGSATDPYDEAIAALLLINDQTITGGDAAADELAALQSGAGSIDDTLDKVISDINSTREAILGAVNHLELNAINSEKYLDDGDAKLDQVNTGGPNVPQDYVAFSLAKVQAASVYAGLAQQLIGMVNTRLGEAQQRFQLFQAKAEEIRARIALANTLAAEGSAYNELILSKIAEANVNLAAATVLVNEGQVTLGVAESYGAEAAHWQNMATITVQEAAVWSQEVAELRQTIDTFNLEADRRLGEFRNALRGTEASHQTGATRRQYS